MKVNSSSYSLGGVLVTPSERDRRFVVVADVTHDFSGKIRPGFEDAASNDVALDLREPDFDLVEPGRVGWCVVDSEVWMLGQKREDSLGLMSGKVVHDDVDFLVGRLGGRYMDQKGNKLRKVLRHHAHLYRGKDLPFESHRTKNRLE